MCASSNPQVIEFALRALQQLFQNEATKTETLFADSRLVPQLLKLMPMSVCNQISVTSIFTNSCKVRQFHSFFKLNINWFDCECEDGRTPGDFVRKRRRTGPVGYAEFAGERRPTGDAGRHRFTLLPEPARLRPASRLEVFFSNQFSPLSILITKIKPKQTVSVANRWRIIWWPWWPGIGQSLCSWLPPVVWRISIERERWAPTTARSSTRRCRV